MNTTRRLYAHQGWKHNIKSEGENVLRFRIRDGAPAQVPPKGTGIVIARSGKEEGVAWGSQIFPEQVVSQRSSLWLDEKTSRTEAEKPLL